MSDLDPVSGPAAHPKAESIHQAVVQRMDLFRFRLDGLPTTDQSTVLDAERGRLIQVGDDIFRNFTVICVDKVVPRLRKIAEDRQVIINALMSPDICVRILALGGQGTKYKDVKEAGDAFRVCLALDSQSTPSSSNTNTEVPFWFSCIFNVLAEAAEKAFDPDSLLRVRPWRKIKAPQSITIEKGLSTKALKSLVARRAKAHRLLREQEDNGSAKDLRLNLIGMYTKRAPKAWELTTPDARKQRASKDSPTLKDSPAASHSAQDPIPVLLIPAPSPTVLPSVASRSFGRSIQ